MTSPNHVIGGIVITGLFGSFMNLNILANPWYIATTIIASLLPDIDHTRSIIGKIFLPFSRYLNRRYGHRTITHSLTILIGLSLFLAYLEAIFLHTSTYSKIFFLAYFSHLILDMMTVQGVPLLYRFLRNPCVMPGNPDMRFRTGNIRTETSIFCFFLLSAIFLQPLIKNGFWTQYNRFFGTPKHLASEYNKSDDALYVKYLVKQGTEEMRGEGYCIEASENKVVLLEENRFKILDKERYVIKETVPEHTGKQLQFKTIHFINISVDSLNQLVDNQDIKEMSLQSSNPFRYYQNNIPSITKSFKGEYLDQIIFEEIKETTALNNNHKITYHINHKIQTIQQQIESIKAAQAQQLSSYEQQLKKLEYLENKIFNETDIVIKERLLKQIKTLKKIKIPKIDQQKIPELEAKIKELRLSDQIKYQDKKMKLQNQTSSSNTTPYQFTGFITLVLITDTKVA